MNFVLVHGAFHGPWVWQALETCLTGSGHQVFCPRLPVTVSNEEGTRHASLRDWVDAVGVAVAACDEAPVVVGHSLGGVAISGVAEAQPDFCLGLVYVAGYLLAERESPHRFHRDAAVPSPILERCTLTDGGSLQLDPGALELMYESPTHASAAEPRLVPLSPRVLSAGQRLSGSRFAAVPKAYIETTRDGAVPLPLQQRMHSRSACNSVIRLDADHSPMVSQPAKLASALEECLLKIPFSM